MAAIRLRGRFGPGQDVEVFERTGDVFSPGVKIGEGQLSDEGVFELDGLDDGQRVWVAAQIDGEWRPVAMTAKTETSKSKMSAEKVRERLEQTRPPTPRSGQIITGARATKISQGQVENRAVGQQGVAFAHPMVGVETPSDEVPDEPQPYPRQEDMRSRPQRSATLTGSAHPVDPDSVVLEPQPRQDQIDENVPQRSATPLGYATPLDPKEVQPWAKQEDHQDDAQRSATETGQAVPVPTTKNPAKQQEVADSPEAKARGGTVPVAGTSKGTRPRARAGVQETGREQKRPS